MCSRTKVGGFTNAETVPSRGGLRGCLGERYRQGMPNRLYSFTDRETIQRLQTSRGDRLIAIVQAKEPGWGSLHDTVNRSRPLASGPSDILCFPPARLPRRKMRVQMYSRGDKVDVILDGYRDRVLVAPKLSFTGLVNECVVFGINYVEWFYYVSGYCHHEYADCNIRSSSASSTAMVANIAPLDLL
jgi:hypothetical protein